MFQTEVEKNTESFGSSKLLNLVTPLEHLQKVVSEAGTPQLDLTTSAPQDLASRFVNNEVIIPQETKKTLEAHVTIEDMAFEIYNLIRMDKSLADKNASLASK